MTLAEVDSTAEGLLSCLWSVLSVALCGASFLMACGPLPLFLVCTSSPCGQGFVVRFGSGAGESLVIGNYSSANVKSQLCHAHSPQGSAGLLHSRLATGEGSGGDVPGVGSCWHRPLRAQRQDWMLPSLPAAGQPWLLPVLQAGLGAACSLPGCCPPSWLLHLLEKSCCDMILHLPSSWEHPLLLPCKRDRFCGVTWGNARSSASTAPHAVGLRVLPSSPELGVLQTGQGPVVLPALLGGQGESSGKQGTLFSALGFLWLVQLWRVQD